MKKILRIVLWAQVLFFASWGGYLLTSHKNADEIWLKTSPVDPRDFISGHYVTLGYPAARAKKGNCPALRSKFKNRIVYARFEPSAESVRVGGKTVPIWAVADCSLTRPAAGKDRVWGRGQIVNRRIRFGIERFYVTEKSPLRSARSGEVVARVSVNRLGRMRITDLKKIDKP